MIIFSIYWLLSPGTEALNCVNSTQFNLQCPDVNLATVTCLEVGPMSNATTPYDLLCDGVDDCTTSMPGADEGHPILSPDLMCREFMP